MSIKIGSISAKDIYIGSTPAKEIRLGSNLIWSREPEEVYYTLTLNGVDSPGINDYEVKINGEYQPKQTTYQIQQGSYVQVNIYPDTDNYSFSLISNIDGEIDVAHGWDMSTDVVVTVTTTPVEKQCAIIINADNEPNLDYVFGHYSMPGSDEWVEILDAGGDYHLDNSETVYVPKGAEVVLRGNLRDGSAAKVSPNSFIITEDTIVYVTSKV